ncbi:MAG: transglycosylase SLT domain-containing protein [Sphingopyxis sp.]|uniref:transglycosylase SLT domain-containing protein n=1 Tax=Sphingopyxis sp. TaxID=1908224 RepID=UPI002ABCD005|nr:transglycosylase SLT domain-containing protein [Sphingopyxis sp.]MDZ3831863.1 transglycosylase SLT domain-containing protein [Sphingopyxis sp.]
MNPINTPATTPGIAAPVMNAVQTAAARTGIDFNYLFDVARVESGYNPRAQASTSSARGLFQFTRQTWLATLERHGASHGLAWASDAIGRDASGRLSVTDPALRQQILDLRDDPAASSTMAAALTADNREYLESRIGRRAEPVDLYLAHFLGSGGAVKFLSALSADPDQPGATMMPEAASANRSVFYAPDGSMRSLSDIRERFRVKLEEGGKAENMKFALPAGWQMSASSRNDAAGGSGSGRPPLQMMEIKPMPKKLSMGFAADAYRRLASLSGGAA